MHDGQTIISPFQSINHYIFGLRSVLHSKDKPLEVCKPPSMHPIEVVGLVNLPEDQMACMNNKFSMQEVVLPILAGPNYRKELLLISGLFLSTPSKLLTEISQRMTSLNVKTHT